MNERLATLRHPHIYGSRFRRIEFAKTAPVADCFAREASCSCLVSDADVSVIRASGFSTTCSCASAHSAGFSSRS